MFKLKTILLIIIIAGLAFSYKSIDTYFKDPDKKPENNNFIVENIPDEGKRIARLFYIEEEINHRRKASNWVNLDDIPLHMQQAIIAVEDNRFYQHGSFDVQSIVRAMLSNAQAGEIVEGGSTITQQLAKNLFLGQEQTLSRKAEEAIYSLMLENNYTKEEILELYLNTIYFGSGAYGIKDASIKYFHKHPSELTLAECTMLAGLPAAPSIYSPLENPEAAKKRQAIVVEAMVNSGFIGPQKAKDILSVSLF